MTVVVRLLVFVLVTAPLVAANKDRHVVLISIDGFPAYLWRDASIPLPNLRRLAAEGAVADAMTISNPAITWPNHTTLVTGVSPRKHGVLYNGLVVRGGPGKPNKIEPWVDRERLVFAPTVYDAAFKAGLTTAEIDGIFLASGAGIKAGVKLDRVRNLDVAPTIARLLDVPLPTADGRVIEQMLTEKK